MQTWKCKRDLGLAGGNARKFVVGSRLNSITFNKCLSTEADNSHVMLVLLVLVLYYKSLCLGISHHIILSLVDPRIGNKKTIGPLKQICTMLTQELFSFSPQSLRRGFVAPQSIRYPKTYDLKKLQNQCLRIIDVPVLFGDSHHTGQ